MIEPEASYLECLQPSKRKMEYWSSIGSYRSSTKAQKQVSREVVEGVLDGIFNNTLVAFTDGSCRGNPGPCGDGSCIILLNSDKVELKQLVSKLASILLGELVAIKLTLDCILEETTRCKIDSVMILSDTQISVGILHLGWKTRPIRKPSLISYKLVRAYSRVAQR